MGLLGVVAALAMRKTEGIVFLILYQFLGECRNDYMSEKQKTSLHILSPIFIRANAECDYMVRALDLKSRGVGSNSNYP